MCYGSIKELKNDIIKYMNPIRTINDIRKIEELLATKNIAHKVVIQTFQLIHIKKLDDFPS